MPFEEEDLEKILKDSIEYSFKRISDKLGEISSVEGLVELKNDFEDRIHQYFKTVKVNNMEASRVFCLNLITNLEKSCIQPTKINDISEI